MKITPIVKLPDNVPEPLMFSIGAAPQQIHEFSIDKCGENNGVFLIQETNSDLSSPDQWIITDACLNEESRELFIMNDRYAGLLLNTADFRCVWYERDYSGSPKRGNVSFTYCGRSDLVDDVRKSDVNWVDGQIMSPITMVGKRSGVNIQFLRGLVKSAYDANGKSIDGIYQIDISGMPSLAFSSESKIEMMAGAADMSTGKMTV